MSTLNVFFTGLCAFVPNTSGKRMRMLMVDATHPTGAHAVPHRPVLVVDVDQVEQGSGCRPWKCTFPDGGKNEMALFEILNQELWIDGAAANALDFDAEPLKDECPTDTNDDKFRWVASMRRINAGSGGLISHALADKGASREVAARFKLTEGYVTRHRWAEDTLRNIVRWRFSNDDGKSQAGFLQAMVEEVRLRYPFSGPRVSIRSVADIHEDDVQKMEPICLKPQDGVVNVFVANMPDDDIRRRKYTKDAIVSIEAVQPAASGHREDDHHFGHFYGLVIGGPQNRIPRPFQRCKGSADPAAGNPKCPPVQLDADKDA